jgi:N utilization substance protein A
MNKEFFEAVKMLEQEKGIPSDYLYDKIATAICTAAKHNYNGKDIVHCEIDPEKEKMKVYCTKNVVEEIEDPDTDLTLEQAQAIRKTAKVGKTINIPLKTKDFSRIVAQTAKQVIRQALREAERGKQLEEFRARIRSLSPLRCTALIPSPAMQLLKSAKPLQSFRKASRFPARLSPRVTLSRFSLLTFVRQARAPRFLFQELTPAL